MLANTLTDKERRFCEEYIVDYNAKRAATIAGYTADWAGEAGYQVLQRPDVIEYLNHLKGEQTIRTKVNADYVLNAIVETLERCRQEVRPVHTKSGGVFVVQDANGEPANAFKFDAKNVLKAAELLGKHLAMFTDVVDNRMTFTQMTEVKMGTPEGEVKELSFEVGGDPLKAR